MLLLLVVLIRTPNSLPTIVCKASIFVTLVCMSPSFAVTFALVASKAEEIAPLPV